MRESINGRANYLKHKEALSFHLANAVARFEVIVASQNFSAFLDVDLDAIARHMLNASLILQVLSDDILGDCNALVNELYAPLEAGGGIWKARVVNCPQ